MLIVGMIILGKPLMLKSMRIKHLVVITEQMEKWGLPIIGYLFQPFFVKIETWM